MPALLKFLVLLASFHSGSYAHAFTSLSPVAGNQVRVNHLIRFQQPMSNPTNEPSRKPIREPTNDRKKSEPIVSYSHIKRDKSTPTFQLVVASISNNNALYFNDKPSSKFQLVVASVTNEFSKGLSKKQPTVQWTTRGRAAIIHWWCVNWLVAMPNEDWQDELPASWKQCVHSTCGLLPRLKNQSELETVLSFNSWASAMIKKQSLLETMLPLSSWAPVTIKIQSELETVLSLNLWISAMITNESEWHSTNRKRMQCFYITFGQRTLNTITKYKEEPLQKHCCADSGIQSKLIFTSEKINAVNN